MSETKFESFGIVELFGHNIIAGKITEQTIGGQGFVRVDVPSFDGLDGYTKFFGSGSIYAITPTDESTAIEAAKGLRAKPIEVWKLHLMPQLTKKVDDEYDDEYDDEDDEPVPF